MRDEKIHGQRKIIDSVLYPYIYCPLVTPYSDRRSVENSLCVPIRCSFELLVSVCPNNRATTLILTLLGTYWTPQILFMEAKGNLPLTVGKDCCLITELQSLSIQITSHLIRWVNMLQKHYLQYTNRFVGKVWMRILVRSLGMDILSVSSVGYPEAINLWRIKTCFLAKRCSSANKAASFSACECLGDREVVSRS